MSWQKSLSWFWYESQESLYSSEILESKGMITLDWLERIPKLFYSGSVNNGSVRTGSANTYSNISSL